MSPNEPGTIFDGEAEKKKDKKTVKEKLSGMFKKGSTSRANRLSNTVNCLPINLTTFTNHVAWSVQIQLTAEIE